MSESEQMTIPVPGEAVVPDPNAERKVVRWSLWKEVSIWDHRCDKLPEGVKFHKFRIQNTPDEQHAFISVGRYEREVVCPYCGKHIVYVFTNVRRSGKATVKALYATEDDEG